MFVSKNVWFAVSWTKMFPELIYCCIFPSHALIWDRDSRRNDFLTANIFMIIVFKTSFHKQLPQNACVFSEYIFLICPNPGWNVHFFTSNEFSVKGSSLLITELFLCCWFCLALTVICCLGVQSHILCAVLFSPYLTIYMYKPHRKHT
jgi:hypothetical protein